MRMPCMVGVQGHLQKKPQQEKNQTRAGGKLVQIMAYLSRSILLLVLLILDLASCQNGDQIPVTLATATGQCCAECPGGSINCVGQFSIGNLTDPCTITLCEYDASEVVDEDTSTSLILSYSPDVGVEVEISLTLELGIVSCF